MQQISQRNQHSVYHIKNNGGHWVFLCELEVHFCKHSIILYQLIAFVISISIQEIYTNWKNQAPLHFLKIETIELNEKMIITFLRNVKKTLVPMKKLMNGFITKIWILMLQVLFTYFFLLTDVKTIINYITMYFSNI